MDIKEAYNKLRRIAGDRNLSVSLDLSSWAGERYQLYVAEARSTYEGKTWEEAFDKLASELTKEEK